MQKLLFLGFILFLFAACNPSDKTDCDLVDCAFQTFSIAFVDDEGTNLIANGTFSETDVSVSKNDNQLSFNVSQENQIFFEAAGEQGENTYIIRLSQSRTDEMVLDLNRKGSGNECCGPFFDVSSAAYTNSTDVLIETKSFVTEFTIVLEQ